MEFKDYYATLGVAEDGDREGNQAGVPQAGAQAPSRRQPGRQGRRGEVQGDQRGLRGPRRLRQAQEVRRARRQLAGVRAGRRRRGGRGGPAAGTSTSAAAAGGGFRTMTPGRNAARCSATAIRSPISSTRSSAARRQAAETGRDAAAARARGAAPGPRRRAGDRAGLEDAFHGTTRRLPIKHDGHARTVDVRIPAGVGDGSRVRVAGEGEHGTGGAKSGDLYLRIRLAPHPRSSARAGTSTRRSTVPLTTAVLGGEADVPTLAGKSLRLKIPPTTQNGQVFRLKGHGMPAVEQAGRDRRSLRDGRGPAAEGR